MRERLIQIMNLLGMNPTQFANALGIQRTSIQHIISGRNEPSLKIISCLYEKVPNINSNWLLTGQGTPFLSENEIIKNDQLPLFSNSENQNFANQEYKNSKNENLMRVDNPLPPAYSTVNNSIKCTSKTAENKKIKEVMILYEDGTFELFHSK